MQAGYIAHQIFADGNTFRESRSVDYDPEFIGISTGFAYSWQDFALTFAMNNSNVIQSGDTKETLDNLNRYGTLTAAWRM